jgi:glycine betaine catabolism A
MHMNKNAQPGQMQKSLPSSYYFSEDIFAREKELIFCREWFCVAREEELSASGDHLVLDVAGESILLVRNKQGELKAHYNVCRHRGARLCSTNLERKSEAVPLEGGITPAPAIRCPYHMWTYDLDGHLIGAPHLREGEGFSKSDFSLYPVDVDTWGGFVFVNLSPREAAQESRTLRAQLGAASERVRRYPLRELRSAHRIIYDVAANWKVLMENYNECYHCAGIHPELCEVVPAFKENGGAHLDWDNGIHHRPGAFTFTRSGTTTRSPFPTLNDAERTRHKGELCYPNFLLSLSPDHVTSFSLWPVAPGRTRIVCDFLFHPTEMARGDFDPGDAVEFWDLINRQDWTICERVQVGMRSRMHKFGYYAPIEDLSLDIRRYVTERLGTPEE